MRNLKEKILFALVVLSSPVGILFGILIGIVLGAILGGLFWVTVLLEKI